MREFWPGTQIPKSKGNAFDLRGSTSAAVEELRRADTAARVGKASAATKRARGQATMPALPLKGSRPKFKEEISDATASD